MKKQIIRTFAWGLLAAGLPLVGGCSQGTASPPQGSGPVYQPVLAVASPGDLNAAMEGKPAGPETPPGDAKPVPSAQALAVEKPAPANVKLSPPVAEVVKLAQAGLSDSVMLAYVTNSAYTFNLASDQIIYLNDLGVSGEVVTAMIQHDQNLSQAGAQAAPAPTAPLPEPAQAAVAPPPDTAPPTYAPDYAAASAQPQQVDVNYFHDSLAPYGSWINVDGYGLCWQPTVTVIRSSWQPYGDNGRWIYTDCGWYWQSDYSWGWAPFHYGRWFRHNRWGWCWWPDRVWAPSWVTWRYSGDYCGWAPLPPFAGYSSGIGFSYYNRSVGVSFNFGLGADCYTFVPFGRFCDSRPHRYYLPRQHVTQIFNHTTIVNNNVNIRGNNNTVTIHNSVVTDRVRGATRNEIHQVVVRDLPASQGRTHPTDRVQREGRSLVVYRPHLPERVHTGSTPTSGSVRTERPGEAATARPGNPAGIATSNVAPGRGQPSRPIVGQPRRTVESPAAAPGPNRETPRGSTILMGNQSGARPPGQSPARATTPPRPENSSRARSVEPGTSRAPAPDSRRNVTPLPAPRSNPTIQQPQLTPPPVPTQKQGTTVNRPPPQVQTGRQTERAFNPEALRPPPARPQYSPPPSPAPRPAYAASGAPAMSPPAPRSAPMPSYTPRPAPSAPPPAMSAPRAPSIASRPMPAPAPRASSPPPSPSPSRSESGRQGRER